MQAVRHYSRTWPIDAVPAKVAARAALLVSWASPTDPEQQAVRRWLMSRVLAAAVSVAAEPVEQAVQHYSRTLLPLFLLRLPVLQLVLLLLRRPAARSTHRPPSS